MVSSNACSLIVRGGTVVCVDRVLENHDVVVRDGVIAAVVPSPDPASAPHSARAFDAEMSGFDEDAETGLAVVDARGAYVAPGMVDIHSDYIENIASPRPSVVMDLATSLYKCDRELVGHGVTSIFHSLSVIGNDEFKPKPIRRFENVSRLIAAIRAMRADEERDHLIRHRMHLRIELDAVERYDEVAGYLESGQVDLVSFMDHTPGQGQYRDLLVYAETVKGYHDEGMTDAQIAEVVRMRQDSAKLSFGQLEHLASAARAHGIAIASHDDDSEDKLDVMERLGARISEFPIDLATARSARARGMHTLAGAPNVVMGRSHSGNLSAREAVAAGAIDVLCSDYYPAALLNAVFVLHRECGLDLARAFALVSANPARAAGIDGEVGSIAPGKKADMLVVREIGCKAGGVMPVVTRAFVGGHSVYRTHYPSQPFGYGAPTTRACDAAKRAVRPPAPGADERPAAGAHADVPAHERPLLSIRDLSKSFVLHNAGRTVSGCSHVSFDIMPGQFVGITGRSGSGKSTILRCIYRTNRPESGSIVYDSASRGPIDLCTADERQVLFLRKNELGYVSQFLDALPRQSAYAIVLKSALETFGREREDEARAQTEAMLRHFDIDENLWELFPRTFSGGEKLRLNIAAAMIKRPRLLLLDEPTASLDNASKLKVRELIEQLKGQGTTMLGIFHDLEFMEGLCDREFNMQKGVIS